MESILESEEKYNLCVWKFYQKHFGKLKIDGDSISIPLFPLPQYHFIPINKVGRMILVMFVILLELESYRERDSRLNQAA